MHLTACLSAMTAILTMSFPTVSPTPSLSPYLLSSSSFHLVNPPHSHLAPASQTPATNSMQALANDHRLSRDCSMYHDGAKRCSYYRGEVEICEGGIGGSGKIARAAGIVVIMMSWGSTSRVFLMSITGRSMG